MRAARSQQREPEGLICKTGLRTLLALCLSLLLVAATLAPLASAEEGETGAPLTPNEQFAGADAAVLPIVNYSNGVNAPGTDLNILFTTDTHSQVAPRETVADDGSIIGVGGFSRLKTAMDASRTEGNTLTFDSGDFLEGTLFASLMKTNPVELGFMNEFGFDAVALGNHDFDYGDSTLAQELDTFFASGATTQVLCSNLISADADTDQAASVDNSSNPLAGHGLKNWTVIERNGYKVGVFALMGKDADVYTATEEFSFADQVKTAQACADYLRNDEGCDIVICLSHSGVTDDKDSSEDDAMAAAVDGIDVIVSGHQHRAIDEELEVKQPGGGITTIVSSGSSLENLGRLQIARGEDGSWYTTAYELIPLDETVASDAAVDAQIKVYEQLVNDDYLKYYGISGGMDGVVAPTPQTTESRQDMEQSRGNWGTGNLVVDAYDYALEQAGVDDVDLCICTIGAIRAPLCKGEITVGNIFDVLSLYCSDDDGKPGSPLITGYFTGKDLYNAAEVSASLSPSISGVQVAVSGMRYEYSDSRLFLNRVSKVELIDRETGEYHAIKRDDTLYKVSSTLDIIKLMGLVEDQSFGLLSATIRYEDGTPIPSDALTDRIVYYTSSTGEQRELKEWIALEQYLASFDPGEDGRPVIPARYLRSTGQIEQRAVVVDSGFLGFFSNPGKVMYVLYAVVLVLIVLIVGIVFLIRHLRKRRRLRAAQGVD